MAGDSSFAFKSFMFALTVPILLSLMINVLAPGETPLNSTEIMQGYSNFTGSSPSQESVWVLTGIYTSFGEDENGQANTSQYGYTSDGWLYGASIQSYTPYQYSNNVQKYTVSKVLVEDDGNGGTETKTYDVFRYTDDTAYGNHKKGDLYTDVSMSLDRQSDIFFTPEMKTVTADGFFYYQYTGYRYAFQPLAPYRTLSVDGDLVEVVPNTTSLSLIWYNYYTSTGISGQLIISGQDMSVAYLTAGQILQAFNSTTNTAKFSLTFTGIAMNVYVKLDPTMLASGLSVEDCYNGGFWSLMVTSDSADATAYTQSDYSINAYNLWNTVVDLFTFNYDNYNISDTMGLLCTFLISAPFYAMMIALCTSSMTMLIGTGLLAAVQAIATAFNSGWLGGLFG